MFIFIVIALLCFSIAHPACAHLKADIYYQTGRPDYKLDMDADDMIAFSLKFNEDAYFCKVAFIEQEGVAELTLFNSDMRLVGTLVNDTGVYEKCDKSIRLFAKKTYTVVYDQITPGSLMMTYGHRETRGHVNSITLNNRKINAIPALIGHHKDLFPLIVRH